MRQKDLDYLVAAALTLCGLYVAITGFVADVFGFPQITLHAEVGYACAVLGALHLALNWRQVTTYIRRRFGRRRKRERQASPSAAHAPAMGRRGLLVSGLAALGGVSPEGADIGELYHQWSKPNYASAIGAVLDWGTRPEQRKVYADAEHVALADPGDSWGLSLGETVDMRRSVRRHAGRTLPLDDLSRLLHAAQGITDQGRGYRAAPSAGALYPIELYAVVHDVDGLQPGIYHYAVQEHELELLQSGDSSAAVTFAGLGQSFLGQANVCFILSAVFQRTRWRYRERTYRYVMLEAGHVGQNLYLAATAMGLGACAVGAFLDDEFNDLLGLDGMEEAVLYAISVGTV
jgi:SagB-type dehydrogenase family enzyme